MNYGKTLLNIRKAKGLTQRQVASDCGLSANALCSIEKGKSLPTKKNLESIASALGVKVGTVVLLSIEVTDLPKELHHPFTITGESLRTYLLELEGIYGGLSL